MTKTRTKVVLRVELEVEGPGDATEGDLAIAARNAVAAELGSMTIETDTIDRITRGPSVTFSRGADITEQ